MIQLLIIIIIVVIIVVTTGANSRRRFYARRPDQTLAGLAQLSAQHASQTVLPDWFFVENGVSIGPVTWVDLGMNCFCGRVKPATLVFGPGMTQWIQAQLVNGLVFPTQTTTPAATHPATWTCGQCGQQVVENVELCWNCGAEKVR